MGVPALFRWLSAKYPKIITPVQEEQPRTVPDQDGVEKELPIDMSRPNPNGEEFDCLYLDMNGIVHPCTHPEGKPAPETEEDMMVEVFAYTERVVNMIRPRRLLMMAIDGVAPRAKMNQQRSRRFRSARDAKEALQDKEAALAEWKAKGLPVTDEAMQIKKAWDSNAITPGTPFMDLLAASLRYWVAQKLNTDPGWKNLQVIISDASVPGEGEHKIMEHIRRQRCQPQHDPNTKHVIYGLDADLIMLALATHEPYFKVLREDVFSDSNKDTCRICNQKGHFAKDCKGEKPVKDPNAPVEKKPFVFLDVSVLREYLAVELNYPGLPFAFDLERAIDDWVFLIFFVGNDFLPHLPSLELREGAIDTLLKIWRRELPNMGGYLTKHGSVELAHAQLILAGLAQEEDEIFRKRKELEERQEANRKRRAEEDERRKRGNKDDGFKHGETDYVEVKPRKPKSAAETEKPAFNGMSVEEAKQQANANAKSYDPRKKAVILGGDNNEVVRNRHAARQANKDAAEALKAELAGNAKSCSGAAPASNEPSAKKRKVDGEAAVAVEENGNANGSDSSNGEAAKEGDSAADAQGEASGQDTTSSPVSKKRKADEADADADADAEGEDVDDEIIAGLDDDEDDNEDVDPVTSSSKRLQVNPDGTVTYEDTVKLWEPGYRERYYRDKFNIDLDDTEKRRHIVKSYTEGLCWVLAYYYQGVPSWQWYYPYHFSPFAADFTDLDQLDIKFELGQPFKPFEQLMGVLPAASQASIPTAFRPLMTEEDSEIIDYYPEEFQIDMNGKKMAWQGVALLPFIDEKRLLAALKDRYPMLSEDEVRRNAFGHNTYFVSEESKLYDFFCALYAKGGSREPVQLDASLTGGITGSIRPDPVCVPGSTFNSPLTSQDLHDILNDRSISVLYDFPPQSKPHRSVLLKGARPPKPVLTGADIDWVKRGGPNSRGRGRGRGGGRGGPPGRDGGGGHGHGHGAQGQAHGYGNGGYDSASSGGYGGMRFGSGTAAYGGGGYGGYGAGGGGGGYGGYGGSGGYDGGYGSPYGDYNSQGNGATPAAGGYGGGGGGYGGYGSGAYNYGQASAAAAPAPGGYGGYGATQDPYAGYGATYNSRPTAAGGYGAYPAPAPAASYGYGSYGAPPAQGAYGGYGGYGAAAATNAPYGGYGRYGAPTRGAARGGPPQARGRGRGGPPGRGAYGGGGTYGSFY
ncbi:5'-3' exoribonuclease 2 [Thecaphora frezii]